MAKKKEQTREQQLLAIIKRLETYTNAEGVHMEGCLGCGAYPESSDNNIIVHEEGCDWIALRDLIEQVVG